jgi:molecular chaperone GrpE
MGRDEKGDLGFPSEPSEDPAPNEEIKSDSETNSVSSGVLEEPATNSSTATTNAQGSMIRQPEPHSQFTKEAIQSLTEQVAKLSVLLEEANGLSRERERIIDRLHQENQQLRGGEIWQALTPLLRDLVRLYDDLNQTEQRYQECGDTDGKEVARDFAAFRDSVEDLLYRQGIERYDVPEATTFNSKEHKALGVISTVEERLDRSIARIVRSGFRTDSRIIRILEAEVYRFTAAVVVEDLPKDDKKDQPASSE